MTPQNAGWRRRLPHLLLFAVIALIYAVGGLDWLEYRLMDSRFSFDKRVASGSSVHVGIDSRSLRDLDAWPWSRRHHADLIRRLTAAGVARIMLDIDLSSSSTPESDADLAAAIREADGKVALPVFKQRAAKNMKALVYTGPLSIFQEHAQTASVNIQPESDSLVRRYNRAEFWQSTFIPSMATQLSGLLPDSLEPFYLDFSISPVSVPYFSYVDVLRGRFPPDAFRGKTVFVGATAVELGDILAVPAYGALAGSMLQILAYESMKLDRAIERSASVLSYVAALLLAVFLGPRVSDWSWQRGLAVTLGSGGVVYAGAVLLQAQTPVSADISPVLLILLLSYFWSLIQKLDIQSLWLFKQHMAAVHRNALMTSVVDESFDGIVITDGDGRIDFANPAACHLLGVQAGDVTGQNILRFLRADTEVDKDLVHGSTATQVLVKSKSTELEAKDGERIPVEYSITIASLAPGQSPFEYRTEVRSTYIYTFHDIRESQKAEVALRAAADKAIAADHAKSELLANVSHELRTPLNAIIGFSSLMNAGTFGALGHSKYQEYTSDILYSGEHLLELVNNILTVSRVDSGNYDIVEEPIDLAVLIHDCINIISASCEGKQLTLESDVAESLPHLLADSKCVRQIVLNLMGNAVKFTPVDGTVRVMSKFESSGEISLTVADNGIGISQTDLQRITLPFEQVEGAMQRTHGGVGLGLHIVCGLAELHDAKLDIASELGVGTKISVRFPRERVEGLKNVVPISSSSSRNTVKRGGEGT